MYWKSSMYKVRINAPLRIMGLGWLDLYDKFKCYEKYHVINLKTSIYFKAHLRSSQKRRLNWFKLYNLRFYSLLLLQRYLLNRVNCRHIFHWTSLIWEVDFGVLRLACSHWLWPNRLPLCVDSETLWTPMSRLDNHRRCLQIASKYR